MENWKRTLVNLFGVVTTAATLVVIYFVLYMVGVINTIDKQVITEFAIVLVLVTSVKTFWYASIESSYYSSEEYTEKIRTTSEQLDANVTDANDFDEFIKYENINNYNKVLLNSCEGLTVANYKYRWFDNISRFFRAICSCSREKRFYVERFVHRIERKAMRRHKLSAANILAFSTTRYGLTDDRNPVRKAKFWYIVSGIVVSTVLTFVTALLSFAPNPDTDTKAAAIKFISYAIQIMYAILQTILHASTSVRRGTATYCNNIITIIDKYKAYKDTDYRPTLINYMEEFIDGCTINHTEQTSEEHDNCACGESGVTTV